MPTLEEKVMKIVDTLGTLRDVRGVAIANTDGFVIASKFFAGDVSEEKFAGMVSESVSYYKRILDEVGAGHVKSAIVEGEKGKIALIVVGEFIVIILGGPDLNLGLARSTLQEVAKDLE